MKKIIQTVTIKKAQNGTTKKKNIFGGSYVSPYTVKGTAKNTAKKIGHGIQAVADPTMSALHKTGDALAGAYEIQKKMTKEAWNAKKKSGGTVKAQSGARLAAEKAAVAKKRASVDSASAARKSKQDSIKKGNMPDAVTRAMDSAATARLKAKFKK